MKMIPVALALATLTSAPAFAGSILTVTPSGQSLDVAVSKDGRIALGTDARDSFDLITKGAGIRTALFGIHAYQGELLVNKDDVAAYSCDATKALADLKNIKVVAIRINVLFNFDKAKLTEALNAGFAANGVNPNGKDVKDLLAKIEDASAPNARSGAQIVFAGRVNADGTETVTYENGSNDAANPYVKSTTGAAGLIKAVFGLWLGKTNDGGLKALNTNLQTCKVQ
jgi:hypothetical protein